MTTDVRTNVTGAPAGPGLRSRLSAPLACAGGVLAATVALAVANPNTQHVPICPLKATTGLDCPGCGGLRCVHDLAHGQLAAAANQNILALTLLPFAVVLWVVWFVRRWRGDLRPVTLSRRTLIVLGVVAVAFAVVRNLPFVPYLRSGLG